MKKTMILVILLGVGAASYLAVRRSSPVADPWEPRLRGLPLLPADAADDSDPAILVPSPRFSEEELRWARLAFGKLGDASDIVRRAEEGRMPAGLLELVLRFLPPERTVEVLKALRAGGIGDGALPSIEVGLRTGRPVVQAWAAVILIDCGRTVDPALLWRSIHDGAENARAALVPLARAGDPEALARLREILAKGSAYRDREVLDLAADFPRALLPVLAARLKPGGGDEDIWDEVWFRAGGTAQELARLRGGIERTFPAAVANLEAVKNLVRKIEWCAERPETDRLLRDCLHQIYRLAMVLGPKDPVSLGAVVVPTLENILPRLDDTDGGLIPERRTALAVLANCEPGRMKAMARLEALSWEECRGETLRYVADALARVPGAASVRLLVKLFQRARRGWPFDDTDDSEQTSVHIARILKGRSAVEKELARSLLEGGFPDPVVEGVLLALGKPLEPAVLSDGLHGFAVDDLVTETFDPSPLAALLPDLRRNPERNWVVLGLLRDEASIDALGARFLTAARAHSIETCSMVWPLRRIASPKALPYLYESLDDVRHAAGTAVLETIGELEDSHRLRLLAEQFLTGGKGRSITERIARSADAAKAFLTALGRR